MISIFYYTHVRPQCEFSVLGRSEQKVWSCGCIIWPRGMVMKSQNHNHSFYTQLQRPYTFPWVSIFDWYSTAVDARFGIRTHICTYLYDRLEIHIHLSVWQLPSWMPDSDPRRHIQISLRQIRDTHAYLHISGLTVLDVTLGLRLQKVGVSAERKSIAMGRW